MSRKNKPGSARNAARRRRRAGRFLLIAAGLWLAVGPWPLRRSRIPVDRALAESRAALAAAAEDAPPAARGPLRAGWAERTITPNRPAGLCGYGERRRAPAAGVHDELRVKALALDNGHRTLLLLGADLLVVPEDLATAVEAGLAEAGHGGVFALLSGTHTHSGPNPWKNRTGSLLSGGAYDPRVGALLRERFLEAGLEALERRQPASWAAGRVNAEDLVANRARTGQPLDHWIEYLALKDRDGGHFLLVNFSAHATILGPDNLFFSADYPGFLQQALEKDGRTLALFQAGAVGSTRPQSRLPTEAETGRIHPLRVFDQTANGEIPPAVAARFARAAAYGHDLAERILADRDRLTFRDDALLDAVSFSARLPPGQIRLGRRLRASPLLTSLAGFSSHSRIRAWRMDQLLQAGLGAEVSGECSRAWKASRSEQGAVLWIASFTTDYLGYLSPDRFFDTRAADGRQPYETGFMSWLGPHAEYYFTVLLDDILTRLGPWEDSVP